MKSFIFSLLALAALSGCMQQAQLVTLRGNNVKPIDDGLVFDTDTLTLNYGFSSERGKMELTLINKLNRPLYVDWKRSAFVIGQDQFAYWQDVSDVNLSNWNSQYGRYSIGSTVGTISKSDQVGFILPQTRIVKQQFVIVPNGSLPLQGTFNIVEEKPANDPYRAKPVNVNVYTYSAEQSPLQFRNYLTLSTDKDFKTEFTVDTRFWASDVRVLPLEQVRPVTVLQPNGSYLVSKPFFKPDGFYVPLPVE